VSTVAEYLALADEDDHARLRRASVATHVWLELIAHGYPKLSILLHKQLPLEVLTLLSQDGDEAVRSGVADKRAAAPLLATLAADDSAAVRARVACNAKVPRGVLEALANDPVPFVANAARDKLGLPLVPASMAGRVIGGFDDDVESE